MPAGVRHAYRNDGDEPAHVRCDVRPPSSLQAFLEEVAALSRSGAISKRALPRSPRALVRTAALAERHREMVTLLFPPAPPRVVQRLLFPALARLAGSCDGAHDGGRPRRCTGMNLELHGRVAVVTGASRGIGLAITRTLLDEGARVVATSRRRSPELDALAGDLVHVPADLMDPAAPAEVVARAVEAFGGLDILVNNAGGPPPGDALPHDGFLGRTDEHWRAMLEFNLLATVRACRAALPLLVERGGTIVNVSSGNGREPSPFNVDYSAAKAALMNLDEGAVGGVRAAGRARQRRLPRPGPDAVVDGRRRRGRHHRREGRRRPRRRDRDGRARR